MAVTETQPVSRHTGGPVPTADDLSVLHLHDRHTGLGLSADDLVGMYRTILTARVLDQKIWSLNRMGKAAFVVSRPGPRGRAGRRGVGAAAPGTTSCCPTTATPA